LKIFHNCTQQKQTPSKPDRVVYQTNKFSETNQHTVQLYERTITNSKPEADQNNPIMTPINVKKTHLNTNQRHAQHKNTHTKQNETKRNKNKNPHLWREKETFLTTRGAFTSDFKVPINENPKSSNSVTISMARAPARDFDIVPDTLHPTHLSQLLLTEYRRPTFSL